MINQFKQHISEQLPFLNEARLLIAVSGGLDSVVLTHLCATLKLNIALAHCNFNLRGNESDTDEDFVLQLAKELDLEVFVESFDTETYAKTQKLSTQMAARELRYNWFEDLAEQLHFDYILTAHHADDNLETFLINLSRGTGLDGLTGIPVINDNIVRPLLPFSRDEIENFAKANTIEWREDSSNASVKYLRNKLRHEVIPILKGINPKMLQNFNKTQSFLQDSKVIIDECIEELSNKVIHKVRDYGIEFNIEEIQKLNHPKAYLYELLKDYNFTQWDDLMYLLEAQSGKQVLSSTHRLIKDRDVLLLSELPSETQEEYIIPEIECTFKTPLGIFNFEAVESVLESSPGCIYVDKDKLSFPLVLRKWQEGDYFYPFGMQGKKKLSKYFKDEKLSLLEKENTWLLCSGEAIVWVVGKRGDNRFRVTDQTSHILKIELH